MKVKIIKDLSKSRIEKYKKWQWSHEVLDGCLNYVFCPSMAMTTSMRKYFPEMTLILVYFDGFESHYHHPEFELEKIVLKVLNKVKKNLNYIKNLYKIWNQGRNKFSKLYRQIEKTDLSNLSNKDLLALYRKFYLNWIDWLAIPFFIEGFTTGEAKVVENNFRRFLEEQDKGHKFGEYYGFLTFPEKPSFLNRFLIDLLDFSEEKSSRSKLIRIIEKYSWIRASYGFFKEVDKEYILKELKFLLRRKKEFICEIQSLESLKERKNKLFKRLNVSFELRKQIELMTFLTFWQDERKETCLREMELSSIFLDEFSKRLEIKKDYLKWAAPSEIRELFSKKFQVTELKKRAENCLFVQNKENLEIISGPQGKKIFEEVLEKKVEEGIEELSGFSASPGKVRGVVKILLSSTEEKKMKKGDILVAGMTRPDYMGAIRKAKAIITDEGGITCHAAIVSRELGIPCIVGTKVATKVLKDGDKIEVDANKGLVKIIKR